MEIQENVTDLEKLVDLWEFSKTLTETINLSSKYYWLTAQYCDSQFEVSSIATLTVVEFGDSKWKIPEKYTNFNSGNYGQMSPITLQAKLSDLIDEELTEYLE